MTAARSIFEIANSFKTKAARTFQPVRRNSYNVDDRRALRFSQPVDLKSASLSERLRAAEYYDFQNREQGKRNGPLGHIGIELLKLMYNVIDRRTGRLDPSIDWIMGKLKRSRTAIVSAMKALKEAGFLDWIRRTEPRADADGQGPQIRQVSNAYALKLPGGAVEFIRRLRNKRAGPVPVDHEARRAAEAAETLAMIEALPVAERMRVMVSDPALAEALTKLAASIPVNDASCLSGQNPTPENKG